MLNIPAHAKGRIAVKDMEYWTDVPKDIYNVLKPDAVIVVYNIVVSCGECNNLWKKYLKRFTKWLCTTDEYLKEQEAKFVEGEQKLTNENNTIPAEYEGLPANVAEIAMAEDEIILNKAAEMAAGDNNGC